MHTRIFSPTINPISSLIDDNLGYEVVAKMLIDNKFDWKEAVISGYKIKSVVLLKDHDPLLFMKGTVEPNQVMPDGREVSYGFPVYAGVFEFIKQSLEYIHTQKWSALNEFVIVVNRDNLGSLAIGVMFINIID